MKDAWSGVSVNRAFRVHCSIPKKYIYMYMFVIIYHIIIISIWIFMKTETESGRERFYPFFLRSASLRSRSNRSEIEKWYDAYYYRYCVNSWHNKIAQIRTKVYVIQFHAHSWFTALAVFPHTQSHYSLILLFLFGFSFRQNTYICRSMHVCLYLHVRVVCTRVNSRIIIMVVGLKVHKLLLLLYCSYSIIRFHVFLKTCWVAMCIHTRLACAGEIRH